MSTRTPPQPGARLGKAALAGYARWRDAMQWQRAVDRALRPLGLTHTQLLVLSALDAACAREDETEGVSQAAVAKEAGLDPATTSAVLRTLERRGLTGRDVPFDDRRSWCVAVTSRGERVLQSAATLAEEASASVARRRAEP
jgi:DNA-binding MarR family transcriptional regulator